MEKVLMSKVLVTTNLLEVFSGLDAGLVRYRGEEHFVVS